MTGGGYRILRWLVRGAVSLLYPLRVHGKENLPKTGAAILYCNHRRMLDPVYVCAISPRPVHFMAKQELYTNKQLAWLLGVFNAFPVDRGRADMTAMRTALRLLRDGELLGIFPEGTRQNNLSADHTSFHAGIALMAQKSRVPLIPVYITPYRRFRWVHYHIGLPYDCYEGQKTPTMEEITTTAHQKLVELQENTRKKG